MNYKYNVGDTVRILTSDPECPAGFVGSNGVVIDINPPDENFPEEMYSVRIPDGRHDGFYEDELSALPNAPVRDAVRRSL